MDSIMTLTHWHWLILGVVLLAIETLGTGGFLLGIAVGSIVTAIVSWLGADWQVQVIVFAVLSVASSFAYWRYFKDFNLKREKSDVVINEKTQSLVGRSGKVISCEDNHYGKIMIGDTLWEFKAESSVKEGDAVIVEASEGMLLKVKPRD